MSLTWVRICHDDRPVGAHTTKPIDLHAVGAAADTGTVLTVQEAKRRNGLGTAVAEALLEGGFGQTRLQSDDAPRRARPHRSPRCPLCAHYQLSTPESLTSRPSSEPGGEGARTSMSELLGHVCEHPDGLVLDPKKNIRRFHLTASAPLGAGRKSGKNSFVDSTLDVVQNFYGDGVQGLRPWTPKLLGSTRGRRSLISQHPDAMWTKKVGRGSSLPQMVCLSDRNGWPNSRYRTHSTDADHLHRHSTSAGVRLRGLDMAPHHRPIPRSARSPCAVIGTIIP